MNTMVYAGWTEAAKKERRLTRDGARDGKQDDDEN